MHLLTTKTAMSVSLTLIKCSRNVQIVPTNSINIDYVTCTSATTSASHYGITRSPYVII